jgi:ribose transport system substrate-binding protein
MVRRMGGKGGLLVLEGMPGQQTADDCHKGVKEVLAKSPGFVVISQTGKRTLDEGRNVTENTLSRWPVLNAILGINGEMALGAVEAVKAAGNEGKITISGMDVYPTQMAAVKAGKILYTISQAGVDQVNWSVVAAIRALNEEKVPKKEIRTPVVVVTKENVDKYAEK